MKRKTEKKIWTVTELVSYVRSSLEADSRIQLLWVKGELTNFVHHERSGHMYFTIKDQDAKIKAAMFASNNRRLRFRPQNGDSVFVLGRLSMFEREGQIQLYVQEMQTSGVGDWHVQFMRRKEELQRKGYFTAPKKQLPTFPRCIAVVTSPEGAVIRDIITTAKRRYPLTALQLFPVAVQGTQASEEIAQAVREINQLSEAEVIIVARGGGSLEELWAFNEENVAESIYASQIPVISAVGHETDTTISDLVADVRAPTPTAAAELAVPDQEELREGLRLLQRRLQKAQQIELDRHRQQWLGLARRSVLQQPQMFLQQLAQRIDHLSRELHKQLQVQLRERRHQVGRWKTHLQYQSPQHQWERQRDKVLSLEQRLVRAIGQKMEKQRQLLVRYAAQMDALSPLKVMQRGYSLVYRWHDEQLLTSKKQVAPGDLIRVQMSDGSLKCQIWATED
jgi:exodeoxyribonuclease VII large subunit